MRARSRSYGDSSTRTRSPGRMRILNRRIFPATCPRTMWSLSSFTRNMAFGRASTTSPSNSTFSSLGKLDDPNVGRLGTLLALTQVELHLRTFSERAESISGDPGEVDERVLPPVIRGDEPEALLVAEPLHDACCHTTPPHCYSDARGGASG